LENTTPEVENGFGHGQIIGLRLPCLDQSGALLITDTRFDISVGDGRKMFDRKNIDSF
jgi:hypothetical protein